MTSPIGSRMRRRLSPDQGNCSLHQRCTASSSQSMRRLTPISEHSPKSWKRSATRVDSYGRRHGLIVRATPRRRRIAALARIRNVGVYGLVCGAPVCGAWAVEPGRMRGAGCVGHARCTRGRSGESVCMGLADAPTVSTRRSWPTPKPSGIVLPVTALSWHGRTTARSQR